MPDVFDKAKRSEVMSRIRGRGNRDTEMRLVKLLRQHGLTGWRRHQAITGRPDFLFRASRVAVFVDGCFWHGCPRHCKMPAANRAFWQRKLEANKTRDRRVTSLLRREGWHVIRIWECQLAKNPVSCVNRIRKALGTEGKA